MHPFDPEALPLKVLTREGTLERERLNRENVSERLKKRGAVRKTGRLPGARLASLDGDLL